MATACDFERVGPAFGAGGGALVFAGEVVEVQFELEQLVGAEWVEQDLTGRAFAFRVIGRGGATPVNEAGTNDVGAGVVAFTISAVDTAALLVGSETRHDYIWEFCEVTDAGRQVIYTGDMCVVLLADPDATLPSPTTGAAVEAITRYTIRAGDPLVTLRYLGQKGLNAKEDLIEAGLLPEGATDQEYLDLLQQPANEAGDTVLDEITAAGLVVTGVGGTIDVRENTALTAIADAEAAVIGTGGTIDQKVAEAVADGGTLDLAVQAAVDEAVAPGGTLDVAVDAAIVAGTAVLENEAADLAGVGGPLDLREDEALAAIAAAEAASIAALDSAGTGIIAAASARVFQDDTTALAALAASESGWVRPIYGTHANSMYDNAGATARRHGETLAINQAGINIANRQVLQSLQELTTPFPAAGNHLWHHRAMDAFEHDGRAVPNRLIAPPERWNILNFTSGEIRFAGITSGSSITVNADGTSGLLTLEDGDSASLTPASGFAAFASNFAGGFTFGMDARGSGASVGVRLGQSVWNNFTVPSGTLTAITPITIATASYVVSSALSLGENGSSTIALYVDNLKLYEGTDLPGGDGVDSDWHLKPYYAVRGGFRPTTAFVGHRIDLRRRQAACTFDSSTDEVIIPGHGYKTGDGPVSFATQSSLSRTFPSTVPGSSGVDPSTDRITVTSLQDAVNGSGPYYLTTTGTLPGGLSLATPYYVAAISGLTFKLATSYANAIAGTAVDITDGGSGTHTIQMLLPGGITATPAYFVIRTSEDRFKVATTRANAVAGTAVNLTTDGTGTFWNFAVYQPGVILPESFPTRHEFDAITVSMAFDYVPDANYESTTATPYLYAALRDLTTSVTRDELALTIDTGTGYLHPYPEIAAYGAIRAADLGLQIYTQTVSDTKNCVWIGFSPLLDQDPTDTSTTDWSSPVSLLGISQFGYSSSAAVSSGMMSTQASASGLYSSGHGYDKLLSSAVEVPQHVTAERAQLALDGTPPNSNVTMHIVVGTSIDALSTGWAYQLSSDTTIAPRFNHANKAIGGSGLKQTDPETFPGGWIPYAESEYGAEAAFRGCLQNGWNVVVWIGGVANDYKEVINFYAPGTYPEAEQLGPADLFAFGQRFIDIGKEDPTWAGKYAVAMHQWGPRGDIAAVETWRPTFNTAVETLIDDAADDGWFFISYDGTVMDDPASTSGGVYWSGDQLHWTDAGHAVVADLIKTTYLPILHAYFGVD